MTSCWRLPSYLICLSKYVVYIQSCGLTSRVCLFANSCGYSFQWQEVAMIAAFLRFLTVSFWSMTKCYRIFTVRILAVLAGRVLSLRMDRAASFLHELWPSSSGRPVTNKVQVFWELDKRNDSGNPTFGVNTCVVQHFAWTSSNRSLSSARPRAIVRQSLTKQGPPAHPSLHGAGSIMLECPRRTIHSGIPRYEVFRHFEPQTSQHISNRCCFSSRIRKNKLGLTWSSLMEQFLLG
jgi:hypothetical protein